MTKNILILGSDGLVGRAVFLYLTSLYGQNVWGTTRNAKNITNNKLFFSSETYQKSIERLEN